MKIQGKPTRNIPNNVYTGGITPRKDTFKDSLIEAGIHPKNADSAKNLLFALAIGGFGIIIALLIELF
jgi:hypothetical protein